MIKNDGQLISKIYINKKYLVTNFIIIVFIFSLPIFTLLYFMISFRNNVIQFSEKEVLGIRY
jgi:hypothetical protein